MTPLAQVGHVMKKDLVEARWAIAAYAAVVLVAVGHSLEWRAMTADVFTMTAFGVVMFGMVVAGSLVQADSPTRVNAFWASRPFAPSAMVVAKLALATLVVLLPALVGQLIALESHGLTLRPLAGLLGKSAWVLGAWVLAAMLAAAMTRDLRTFILVLVFTPAAAVLVAATAFPDEFPSFPTLAAKLATAGAAVASAVALLMLLYRTRDDRRRMWGAGALSSLALLAAVVADASPPRTRNIVQLATPLLDVRLVDSSVTDSQRPHLMVEARLVPASTRALLLEPTLVARLRDGSTHRFELAGETGIFGFGVPTLSPLLRWRFTSFEGPERRQLTATLTPEQVKELAPGVVAYSLEGRVTILAPVLVGTMPLVRGASMKRDGVRIEIAKSVLTSKGAWIETSISAIPLEPSDLWVGVSSTGEIALGLVNDSQKDAILLPRTRVSSTSSWLVLPGVDLQEQTATFGSIAGPPGSGPHLDDAWLRTAHVAAWRWVPRGSYGLKAEVASPEHKR